MSSLSKLSEDRDESQIRDSEFSVIAFMTRGCVRNRPAPEFLLIRVTHLPYEA